MINAVTIENKMHAGIDYGSKLAGTTCVCYQRNDGLVVTQSKKNEDADFFIPNEIEKNKIDLVFLDAPLSLPGVYHGNGSDYFYRQADKELSAMSPMFIGGLTARAMRLKSILTTQSTKVLEAYPGGLAKRVISSDAYKNDLSLFTAELVKRFPFLPALPALSNWHQIDSVLAWIIGYRYLAGQAMVFGKEDEGQIYI